METAITIRGLNKEFSAGESDENTKVLENLSLEIKEGEFVSVFGPNGCGKTTLLLILAGVEKPTRGEVLIHGKPPSDAVTGFVFQNYREALLPWRSCLENVAFPLEIRGVPKKQRENQAAELVSRLKLKIDLARPPYMQSGGQQQLVAIARAMISNPDVMIMDEPLSSLDIGASIMMRETIERIWLESRRTTIYVSHDIDDSIYLADRVVVLTGRPGGVRMVLENDLPHPRSAQIGTAKFNELRNTVLKAFYQQL